MTFLQTREDLTFSRSGTERESIEIPAGSYICAHTYSVRHRLFFDVYTCVGGHYKWALDETRVRTLSALEQLAAQAL